MAISANNGRAQPRINFIFRFAEIFVLSSIVHPTTRMLLCYSDHSGAVSKSIEHYLVGSHALLHLVQRWLKNLRRIGHSRPPHLAVYMFQRRHGASKSHHEADVVYFVRIARLSISKLACTRPLPRILGIVNNLQVLEKKSGGDSRTSSILPLCAYTCDDGDRKRPKCSPCGL